MLPLHEGVVLALRCVAPFSLLATAAPLFSLGLYQLKAALRLVKLGTDCGLLISETGVTGDGWSIVVMMSK